MARYAAAGIVNHGVPSLLVDNALAQTFLLFHLPRKNASNRAFVEVYVDQSCVNRR